jgi:hypothetical protein
VDAAGQKTLQRLATTIAIQAETIESLVWKLELTTGADEARTRTIDGVSLAKIAATIDAQAATGPTLDDVSRAIREMQEAIKAAQDAKATLGTVLGFALKLAPLAV